MKTVALIVAAGSSTRFGGEVPKQFREVCGRPLLSWTIGRFEKAASVDDIVVVTSEEYAGFAVERVIDPFGFRKVRRVVIGGATRQHSVLLGLEALPTSTGWVAIHDGARPLTLPMDIDRVVETAKNNRAVILARPISDTVKRAEMEFVITTLDRTRLYGAETPQAFQYDLIFGAHRQALSEIEHERPATDDAELVERRGFKVKVVEPTGMNIKVTTSQDLELVKALIARESEAKS